MQSAGVVLLASLVLSHSLFAAPVDEDSAFSIISTRAHELQSAFSPTTTFPSADSHTSIVNNDKDEPFLPETEQHLNAFKESLATPLSKSVDDGAASFLALDRMWSRNSMDRFQWKNSNSDQRTHTGKRPFVCEYEGCGESFTRSESLKDHDRTHTGERPFVCKYEGCGKSFARKVALHVHVRSHTGERPFICEFEGCGKSFTQKVILKKHVRTHTGERPFVCEYVGCGKSFAQNVNLIDHVRMHIGERLFVCEYEGCGKSFIRSQQLKYHTRTHTGERAFVCEYEGCGKSFTRSDKLKFHNRTHTGERPFVCEYEGCGKSFTQSYHLKNHMNLHSSNGRPIPCPSPHCENDAAKGISSIAVDNMFQSNSISKRPLQSDAEEHFNSKKMKISYLINENQ